MPKGMRYMEYRVPSVGGIGGPRPWLVAQPFGPGGTFLLILRTLIEEASLLNSPELRFA
jgi:hypothetical protein